MSQRRTGQRLLTPKDLAQAIGASESSLKRWIDEGQIAATRTAGGHRRIAVSEATRFIRESKSPLVRPDILGFADLAVARSRGRRSVESPPHDPVEESSELLRRHLEAGEAAEARGLLLSLYLGGWEVAQIVDGPLQRAMAAIGELWRHSREGILIEHRATDLCGQGLSQLRLALPSSPRGPVAIGGAPAGDPYFLPSLAAATVLASIGFQSINLGPNTPTDTLLLGARSYSAKLVWLSVSSECDRSEIGRELETLVAKTGAAGQTLVVGGHMIDRVSLPRADHVHVARSMAQLEAFARGLVAAAQRR